jgi:Sulfate permease family
MPYCRRVGTTGGATVRVAVFARGYRRHWLRTGGHLSRFAPWGSLNGRSVAHRIRGWLPHTPWQVVPGLGDMRGYDRRRQLRPDLIAGVTVAAVAVPAGLGMGELAGLSPVAGLYATLLPLAVYCLFGSSRQLIGGPEGTLAALTATTVAPLAAGRPEFVAPLAAALALAIGGVQIVAGLLRLGSWPTVSRWAPSVASRPPLP